MNHFYTIYSIFFFDYCESRINEIIYQPRTLKLSDSFINILANLPENGMGYQIVKVILKSGKVLNRHKVINSELLMLEVNENIAVKDIAKIENAVL